MTSHDAPSHVSAGRSRTAIPLARRVDWEAIEGQIMVGPGVGEHQGERWTDRNGQPKATCVVDEEEWPCAVVKAIPPEERLWR